MSAELKKLGVRSGTWTGILTGYASPPEIVVTHRGDPLSDVRIAPGEQDGDWMITVAIPVNAIADGVQIFSIHDTVMDQAVGQFYLVAGDTDEDDLRAEVELLRAELDMLKKAFRRHCIETGQG